MPEPYLAVCLARGRTAINTRWPGRDHESDGWIGDPDHQARTSDHNPDPKTGVVRALDLDKDGLHIPTVLAAGMLHPAIRYVIHNRRIYHIDNLFKPQKYTGDNPHTGHVHFSIEHSRAAENDKSGWAPIDAAFKWAELKLGMNGLGVLQLQAYLNGHGASVAVDGRFGPGTEAGVLAFQRVQQIKVDGIVGPQTSGALRTR